LLIPILPTFFGAFSYDLFSYTLIIAVFFALAKQFINRKTLSVFNFLPLIFVFVYQVIFSFLLSGKIDYIKFSLDTSKNFVETLNGKWSFDIHILLIVFPLILTSFIIYLLLRRDKYQREIVNTCLALAFASFLQLQTAFIRSDSGHILRSLFPSVLVTFIIFFLMVKNKFKLYALGFLVFLLLVLNSTLLLGPSNIQRVIH